MYLHRDGQLPTQSFLGNVSSLQTRRFFHREFIAIDMIHAIGSEITQWNTRLIGWVCLTSITLIHSFFLNWGLRIQNTLALVKISILLFLILSGLLVFSGIISIPDRPDNFSNIWEGTRKDPNAFVSGLYSVIWYILLTLSMSTLS